ncbi:MAG: glycosyltransferase family 2 protein [Thermodesulfobacteriota bacterium]
MISVIIPNFNGERVLGECLEALSRQTEPDLEVILVDNGSSDDSVRRARKIRPGLRVIAFDRNRGFAAAVNAGLKAARRELAALLNNDVVVEPSWLAEMKKELQADPLTFGVGSKMLLDPERGRINVVGIKLKAYPESASIGAGRPDQGQYDRPGQVFGVSAGATLYRRKIFEDVGWFDEDYFAYLEDVDLSFRARLLGYRFRYAPRARAYHKKGWTTRTRMNSSFEIRLNARNVLFYQYTNLPETLWRRYRARLLLRHFELTVRHCLQHLHKGEAGPYLAGLLDFYRLRGRVLEKRLSLQARKRVPDEAIAFWLGREVIPDGVPAP